MERILRWVFRWIKPAAFAAAGLAVLILSVHSAYAKYFFNFQTPVTPIGHEFLFIHDLFLAIITAIFIVVFIALLYSLYSHRKSRNPTPATFTSPTTRKAWLLSAAPILLLIFIDYIVLGIPSFNSILALANTANDQLVVVATGSQWHWNYAYPAYGISYASDLSTPEKEISGAAPPDKNYLLEVDHPLVLPTEKKVLIVLKSRDVIHGFWVPAFGIKMDAIPGFIRKTWVKIEKPGIYRGQCSELCGVGHAFMPIVVAAKTPAEFTRWVASARAEQVAAQKGAEKTWTMAELMKQGKAVFDKNCAVCHQPTGLGIAGTFPPVAFNHPFSAPPALVSKLKELGFYKDGKIVEGPLAKHIDIVLDGIPGTAMPAWGAQLNDVDIASVITYERNAFGNNTGETVQPSKVKGMRKENKK